MKYFIYTLIIVVVGFALYVGLSREPLGSSRDRRIEQSADGSRVFRETKIDDRPPVAITVTPIALGGDINLWKFDIAFDTHVGSLDYDLMKVVILSDGRGGAYAPTAWEGPGPSGHHREGVLVFNSVEPIPEYIELMIRDIGGVPLRVFRWNVK